MKSYCIEVNFNIVPLKAFEWNNYDILNGIRITRVEKGVIDDIMLFDTKIETNQKYLLLSDTFSSIAVKLNSNGKVVKRSFLLFDTELNINEYANNYKITKLKYITYNKKIKYASDLEEEKNIKSDLIKSIKAIDNDDKTKYLYYLYFGKTDNYSKEKLISSIMKNESNKYYELYNFLFTN